MKVDGIAGKNTIAKLNRMQNDSSDRYQEKLPKGAVKTAKINNPTVKSNQAVMAGYGEGATMSDTNQINEEITISGSADDLIRMMQLAGASDAKEVGPSDINQEPETPCGASKPEPDMGDMVRMMSATEEDDGPMGDEYDDEPSAPDEVYSNDVSASIPHGDDLHKKKKTYKHVAGGDNPMALEDELRAKLSAALEAKKK